MTVLGFEDLPVYLHPRMRVFLSADLVGSTALKQESFFPLKRSRSKWEPEGFVQPWINSISDFLHSFGSLFAAGWRHYSEEVAPKIGFLVGAPPEFWKSNGDELIFVKEVADRRDLYLCVLAWLRAVKDWRDSIRKQKKIERFSSRVDIKSTLWIAGFPVTNTEVVIPRSIIVGDEYFADDDRLFRYMQLERWYSEDRRESVVRDFIGPSIDTGFRLSSLATPRNCPISVELAWLLATAPIPRAADVEVQIPWPHVRYRGREILKGVMGGRPYPVFWIDLHSGIETTNKEDKIKREPDYLGREEVSSFCESFFDDEDESFIKPFIATEAKEHGFTIPDEFLPCLVSIQEKILRERERLDGERQGAAGEGPSTDVPPLDAMDVNRVVDQFRTDV